MLYSYIVTYTLNFTIIIYIDEVAILHCNSLTNMFTK